MITTLLHKMSATPVAQIAKTMGFIAIALLGLRALMGSNNPAEKLVFDLVKNKFFLMLFLIFFCLAVMTGGYLYKRRSSDDN